MNLRCEICGYESKQLHQHLKSEHGMTSQEYRKIYGENVQMQIGFYPFKSKDKYRQTYVKRGYERLKNQLAVITEIYDKESTYKLLTENEFYKSLYGKAKNRTLIKTNPKLYKSIYEHTNILEDIFKKQNSYKSNYSFSSRIKFIVDYNYDINKLKCNCGKSYTFTKYCRRCPSYHRLAFLQNVTNGGQLVPNYNSKGCEYFNMLMEKTNTYIQHALNGGEHYIKELGYWVDGYDKENNIVYEYDESHHFIGGKLKDKDVKRQKAIVELKGCKFIRIKDE